MIVHKLIKRKMKTIFEHNLIDSTIASVVCILNGRNEKSKKISLERFDNIVSKPLFILFRHEEYRVSCCSIKAMLFFHHKYVHFSLFFSFWWFISNMKHDLNTRVIEEEHLFRKWKIFILFCNFYFLSIMPHQLLVSLTLLRTERRH